jgi:hypothetical protein
MEASGRYQQQQQEEQAKPGDIRLKAALCMIVYL